MGGRGGASLAGRLAMPYAGVMRALAPALLLLAVPTLAACTPAGRFPSLLPRAAEARSPDVPLPPPPPPRAADPAIAARLTALVRAGRAADAAFTAALPDARAAIGAAGPAESESWTRAQEALSRLAAAGGGTVDAVADVDRLALSLGGDGERAADLRAVRDAGASLTQLVQRQRDVLAELAGRLAPAPG